MKNTRTVVGRIGEDAVCQYLIDHGHSILERNWRTGHLEVDIISLDKNGIHFVEVKTRTAPVMVSPEENVRKSKQDKIAKAALRFLSKMDQEKTTPEEWRLGDMEVHLDVASVILDGGVTSLQYFEDAYLPLYV